MLVISKPDIMALRMVNEHCGAIGHFPLPPRWQIIVIYTPITEAFLNLVSPVWQGLTWLEGDKYANPNFPCNIR